MGQNFLDIQYNEQILCVQEVLSNLILYTTKLGQDLLDIRYIMVKSSFSIVIWA